MKISTKVEPGGIIVVHLNGKLDQITIPVVRKRLSLTLAMGYRQMVINLDRVVSLEQEGVAMLHNIRNEAHRAGVDLHISDTNERMQSLLSVPYLTLMRKPSSSTKESKEKNVA
jgi:anti-sigma B factor antagonist